MQTTPRSIIDGVVRSVCGQGVEHLDRLTSGGLHETYRVGCANGLEVIVRIARRPTPWFVNEEHAITRARAAGIPTPDVLGVERVDHDDGPLSFSVLSVVPGRALAELVQTLSESDVERLVASGGELLAVLHTLEAGPGSAHDLEAPGDALVAHAVGVAREAFGSAAAMVVERGVDYLRTTIASRPAPRQALAHGDWLPKHLMVHEGRIAGVIDWEFTGPASPAFDLAHWELAGGEALQDRSDLLRGGYARVADPDAAADGWVPAFAIAFALAKLAWKNPAPAQQMRRCIEVIDRHA